MAHWLKRIGFAAFTGFVAGSVIYGGFWVFEWSHGRPVTGLDAAFAAAIAGMIVAWRA